MVCENTHMLVHTPTDPTPSICCRVRGIRHIRAGVKAPGAALLAGDLVPVAKERPDRVWSTCVPRMVLLHANISIPLVGVQARVTGLRADLIDRVNEREHLPWISIDYESTIELVSSLSGFLHRHGRVWLAECGRRFQVA